MQGINRWENIRYGSIGCDERWTEKSTSPLLMHSIHTYPAKFPAYIAEESFRYAIDEHVDLRKVADIFCGCGTVALEAKRRKVPFWGCDINPVATLIAETKVTDYDNEQLVSYYKEIINFMMKADANVDYYENADERLKYWFDKDIYNQLYRLLNGIESLIHDSIYRNAFFCMFSSLLKNCSRWLQKSIKPQRDMTKHSVDVCKLFQLRFKQFITASSELKKLGIKTEKDIHIFNQNILNDECVTRASLIVSSPPYVTSYEYADLHQLSSLWLGYCKDYRELRSGSIGSTHNYDNWDIQKVQLNQTASEIIKELRTKKVAKNKILPIARYYYDMQQVIRKCSQLLEKEGMAVFVIGDSELQGTTLLNSQHLIESMFECGFEDVKISKRVVSKGICVPYRDEKGRFTKQEHMKKTIYREEYIISGRIANA